MAIDPRISLAVQAPNVAPAIQIFENALTNGQNRAIRQQQAEQQALMSPLLQQAQQLANQSNEQVVQQQGINLQNAEDKRDLTSLANFYELNKDVFNSDNPSALLRQLEDRRANLAAQGRNTQQTDEAIQRLESGDVEGVVNSFANASNLARQSGLIKSGQSAAQSERNALIRDANSEDPLIRKSARIKLGLDPRAQGSANLTIAESGNIEDVANVVSTLAEAGEGGKLDAQAQKLPNIKRLVKDAEIQATKTGQVMTDLNRAKAALPGIQEVVGKLKEIAPLVTSTFGGALFDQAAKQLGFGSTKGATAKAKFVSMVDNQVLPLLRDTFGAAFTAAEGDRLRDAMANPDASPDQKIAQLNAFIEQKVRSIETNERELEGLLSPQQNTGLTTNPDAQMENQVLRFDAQGNLI